MSDAGLKVLEPGRSSIQDQGRSGHQQYGVSVRGSSDQYSAAMACALVANSVADPLIEITGLGISVQAVGDLLLAVTGAACELTVDGSPVPTWQPVAVTNGSTVRLSRIQHGIRCYLAVHGKVVAAVLLGSVAPDPGLEFGWYLSAGDFVHVRHAFVYYDHPYTRHPVMLPPVTTRRYTTPAVVEVASGPDLDDFVTPREVLESNEFHVDNDSDEVGLRLSGLAPTLSSSVELRSRGVSIGAVEVTPAGALIALMRGRMLTAGYPVVAVATTTALSVLGQLQPADVVKFLFVTPREAVRNAKNERAAVEGVAASVRNIVGAIGLTLGSPDAPSR